MQHIQSTTNQRYTNLDFLRMVSDDNADFMKDLVTLFLRNTPPTLDLMEESYQSGNWDDVRNAAHKMKPTFSYMGLKQLEVKAARIEDICRNQDNKEEINPLIGEIKYICEAAFTELKEDLQKL